MRERVKLPVYVPYKPVPHPDRILQSDQVLDLFPFDWPPPGPEGHGGYHEGYGFHCSLSIWMDRSEPG